jgi:hypothetical protein
MRSRIGVGRTVWVAVVAGALTLPLGLSAPAVAAQTVGRNFVPTTNGCISNRTRFFGMTAGIDPYVIPHDGVLTSWTLTTGPEDLTGVKFKVGTATSATTFTVDAETAAINVPKNGVLTTPSRVPVKAGQRIGDYWASPSNVTCHSADTNGAVLFTLGDIGPGQSFTFNQDTGDTFPLSAQLEPDADHDGFGDETQDACPTDAGTQGACPAGPSLSPSSVDKTKPTLGSFSFSASVFKAAPSGASISAKKKSSVPVGTKVSFSLSEASSVKFTVQRKTKGRKVNGKCKTRTHKNRKKKSCTLYKTVRGSFTVSGKAGKNTFKFTGRMGGKALKPGSYRLTGTASDPSKNTSVPKRKGFKIVK